MFHVKHPDKEEHMIDTPTDNTPLGNRMKQYERAFQQHLPRRTYTLMRLDGRAFHSYLKNSVKPFDVGFAAAMNTVAEALCCEISGTQFAYTQSDEISLLLTDFQTTNTQPWFDGRTDKMLSVAASRAGTVMDRIRPQYRGEGFPEFDCRVWSMSDPVEVANYFIWRQQDAVRNSIQMLGQHHFTPAELHGVSTDRIQEMLFSQHGVNWNDLDPGLKRGRVVDRSFGPFEARTAPHFVAEPGSWLAEVIPPLPSLWVDKDSGDVA